MAQHRIVPSEDRSGNWNRKYDPERARQINEAGKPDYLRRVKAAFINQEQMELGVKQVVNSMSVKPRDVVDYLNFARQVNKAMKSHGGTVLAEKVQLYLNRWVSEGLSQAVLEAIRNDVFHVAAPVGP